MNTPPKIVITDGVVRFESEKKDWWIELKGESATRHKMAIATFFRKKVEKPEKKKVYQEDANRSSTA